MSLAAVKQAESNLLVSTYDRYPLLMKRGKGVYLYDADGKKWTVTFRNDKATDVKAGT